MTTRATESRRRGGPLQQLVRRLTPKPPPAAENPQLPQCLRRPRSRNSGGRNDCHDPACSPTAAKPQFFAPFMANHLRRRTALLSGRPNDDPSNRIEKERRSAAAACSAADSNTPPGCRDSPNAFDGREAATPAAATTAMIPHVPRPPRSRNSSHSLWPTISDAEHQAQPPGPRGRDILPRACVIAAPVGCSGWFGASPRLLADAISFGPAPESPER